MKALGQPGQWGPRIEMVLTAIILAGIGYCAWHVWLYGYLPPPFFFEPYDTFADWFNPAFWSRQEGAYDTWGSVYLPISFIFLRFLGIDRCYPANRDFEGSAGLAARDCDWLGLSMLALIFVLNIVLTWKTFRKIDPRTAPMRTVCIALGMPMLIGLERGNLLLVAYSCMLLAVGPLIASARLRWAFAGLAINFKIYLIGGVIALLLKRRWLWVEAAMISAVAIYLLSLAAFGHGTPMEIAQNLVGFTSGQAGQISDLWSSFTYEPLRGVVETGSFPLATLIGSTWVGWLEIVLPLLRLFTRLLIVAAAVAIWWRPGAFAPHRAVALGMFMALTTIESNIYSLIFVSLFVLMEPWRGAGRIWAIVVCYLLAFPVDVPLDWLPETSRNLYFEESTTLIVQQVTLGPFVRPLLIMTVMWAICFTTLNEFRKAAASRPPPDADAEAVRLEGQTGG